MKAELHSAEEYRLAALRSYGILDTPRESDFDEVVKVAAAICETPISVVNLIDEGRQWFKAEVGLGVRETPIDSSICAHAILQPGLFEVPDTTLDNRFCDNALVLGDPHLRFYAGALLTTPEGFPLGTVCVLDYKPRKLDEKQRAFLQLMASQVMQMIALRRTNATEHVARLEAERLLSEKEMLMREGDHRLMNSLQLVQSLLALQSRNASSDETKLQLDLASNRVLAIATIHKQLHLTGTSEEIDSQTFLQRLCESLKHTAPVQIAAINVNAAPITMLSATASGLGLLVAELVTNSFKYAYDVGQRGTVTIDLERTPAGWRLEVSDEGRGLPAGFDIDQSQGFGMKVIKAFVQRLNATIEVKSRPGHTAFRIEGGLD
ncbi:sensor histidine kinase [Bradyrhizobium roseum]|uniref:sensor histidine kinase n=1 Tax=Bradyrhizobium roseum TaxID=3056648 RepID=UPI002617D01D|nr:histidine kinase dimerization/phosphoacceptor domain -containing protein [Bradyrhizobium roseus]WKA29024.1 histidine kinase dimerization/phosphoacceptor domain -containing protein [Bradyrhizobium roseus]